MYIYIVYATVFVILLFAVRLLWKCFFDREQLYEKKENYIRNEVADTAKKRLEGMSGSLHKLANSFEELTAPKTAFDEKDMELVLEGVSTNLCSACNNCRLCWEKNFHENSLLLREIVKRAGEQGSLKMDELPACFLRKCIHIEDFITETNRNLSLARLKLSWHNCIVESREAVAGQLGEMARIVRDVSNHLCDVGEIVEIQRKKVESRLRFYYVRLQRVMLFERENRGMEIHIRAKCTDGRCLTTKEAASIISEVLHKRLIPREDSRNVIGRDYEDYVFCEDARFKVLTGVARASKNKGEPSGDSFSFLSPNSTEAMMILSDGMGTGVKAARESTLVVELLEQFLEAGFREEAAVKLINSVLVLRSEHTMFSTVDLCVIHLYSGLCEFIKVGAASTFIKRGNEVEVIRSMTMPAGVVNQVELDQEKKELIDGDYVIMVSDGVLDCITKEKKEEFLQQLIQNINFKNPQELANAILTGALIEHQYQPVDDMTVLVTGIWEK